MCLILINILYVFLINFFLFKYLYFILDKYYMKMIKSIIRWVFFIGEVDVINGYIRS